MMTLEIKHQESYSRGELLLRTFFGAIYIAIPHFIVLIFISLAGSVLNFLAWWAILFTGRYPQSWFEFQVKQMRWGLRVTSRLYNLSDGYPAFGLNAADDRVTFEVEYPEHISRGLLLARTFFGWIYVLIPHGIILGLMSYAVFFILFLNWWIVLFTGKIPHSLFDFVLRFLRWSYRVQLYMSYMTDQYPPFHGNPDEPTFAEAASDDQSGE